MKIRMTGVSALFAAVALLLSGCITSTGRLHLRTEMDRDTNMKKYKQVAVIAEYYGAIENLIVSGLVTELVSLGYDVVERTNMGALIKEMTMEQSGLVKEDAKLTGLGYLDKESIKDIGKKLGVDGLLMVYAVPFNYSAVNKATYAATLRLVDVSSGKIAFSTTYFNDDMRKMSDTVFLCFVREHIRELIKGSYRVETLAGQMGPLDKRRRIIRAYSLKKPVGEKALPYKDVGVDCY